MLGLRLEPAEPGAGFTILVLGAHADDIEIGCGGTLLWLSEIVPAARLHWVVLSGDDGREREARAAAAEFVGGFSSCEVSVERFRDGFFPAESGEVKEYFEALKGRVLPDLVLTHTRSDLHQDHRIVSELTWNTFRDHLILEYEVPKYDGDLGSPSLFVHLSEPLVRRKVETLLAHFPSQHENHWYTESTFRALLRLRGIESNSPSGWAEGFYVRKAVLR